MSGGEPVAYAIVVTHQGGHCIEECLLSLLESTQTLQIVVVDNASTDDTRKLVQRFSQITLLALDRNVGFGRANNRGMSYALKKGAEFLFLVNQDVFVEPKTVATLVAQAHSHPNYAILSPVQLDGNKKRLDSRFFAQLVRHDCGNLLLADSLLKDQQPVYSIPFVNAAAWLVQAAWLRRVGGFDPLFFMYGEDNDYSHRVGFHGGKIGIVPGAIVSHHRTKPGLSEPRRPNEANSARLPTKLLVTLKDPGRDGESVLFQGGKILAGRALTAILARDLRKLAASVGFGWRLLQNHRRVRQHRDICRRPGPHWLQAPDEASEPAEAS